MIDNIKKYLKAITPLSVISISGMLFCVIAAIPSIFSKEKEELLLWISFYGVIFFVLLLLIDRYLIKKMLFKNVLITETFLILFIIIFYMYFNKATYIIIETTKPYYALLYDKDGLKKEQIPSSGLFNHTMIFTKDSIVHLNIALLEDNEVQIWSPKSWEGDYTKSLDTLVNGNHVLIRMCFNNYNEEARDRMFNENVEAILPKEKR